MAKKNMTYEDMLKDALYIRDKPYDIPENWIWVKLGSIGEIITGKTPSKKNQEYYGGDFPFIKPSDLDQGRSVILGSEYLSEQGKNVSRILPIGTTSVCCIGTIGKSGFLEIEGTTNQQINSIIPYISKLYIYYYTCCLSFKNDLLKLASATTISIVNKSKMETIAVPLPPLSEQLRIVEIIENLFKKLDRAEELVIESLQSFGNRRSAILHMAFTGELTARWREENGVNFDSWEEKQLGEITEFKYGTSEKSNYTNQGIPIIRIPNIGKNCLNYNDIKYLEHDNIPEQFKLLENDILIIRSNGSKELVGKCAIVGKLESMYTFASYLIRLRFKEGNSRFIMYLLNSHNVKKQLFNKSKSSAGINNINTKELSSVTFLLPQIEEQQQIVSILDDLLEKEEKAKELTDLLDKIDMMKRGILEKAFRGELGTNKSTEESAMELIKKIVKDRCK